MTTTENPLAAATGTTAEAEPRPADPPRRAPRPWRTRLRRLDTKLTPYGLIAPFFIVFAAFGLFPLAYTAFMSLHDWKLLADEHPWVGAGNYTKLLSDPVFWNSLVNTLSIWTLATVPQLFLALWLAHLLNSRIRSRTFFRMGVLLPNVTSVVAVAVIFSQLFGRDFGLFNWALGLIGVDPIDWQADRLASHLAIATMVTWRWTGYNALIFLAAMQAIPDELYEAARIDGANIWHQFRHVTVPMLRPTILFVVIMSTIGGLQLFAEPLLFDGSPGTAIGGTDRQFQTVTMYLYEEGFVHFDFGFASAVAWVVFLLIVVASVINLILARRIRSAN